MARYALVIDYEYCSGCHSCEIACNQEYKRPLGLSGIKVFESIMEVGGKCHIDYVPVRTDLCTFCTGRIKRGKQPACVQHCLAGCLTVADQQNIMDHVKEEKKKRALFM